MQLLPTARACGVGWGPAFYRLCFTKGMAVFATDHGVTQIQTSAGGKGSSPVPKLGSLFPVTTDHPNTHLHQDFSTLSSSYGSPSRPRQLLALGSEGRVLTPFPETGDPAISFHPASTQLTFDLSACLPGADMMAGNSFWR